MRADDDTRDLEQEVAAGQSDATPVALISTVVVAIAVVFAIALGLAALAYSARLVQAAPFRGTYSGCRPRCSSNAMP